MPRQSCKLLERVRTESIAGGQNQVIAVELQREDPKPRGNVFRHAAQCWSLARWQLTGNGRRELERFGRTFSQPSLVHLGDFYQASCEVRAVQCFARQCAIHFRLGGDGVGNERGGEIRHGKMSQEGEVLGARGFHARALRLSRNFAGFWSNFPEDLQSSAGSGCVNPA
jgi:hypothetical protein